RLAMASDGAAREVALTLVTDDGASMAVEGSAAGFSVPVRPADDQPVVVHETPMRLTVDGVPGYGIYEHLVASTG
ncbi:MAG: hypothetical protein Q8K72_18065, partial [Acidimicrobiales bacterium]|nr:hypothetical protein [Acidimicrobiales bacterium]